MTRFAEFTFDADRRLVLDARGAPLHLTPKAFDLLALLIAEAPRVVSKTELHERIWPGAFVADATLVGVIKELRRVLNDRDSQAPIIRTSHGTGYALNVPIHAEDREADGEEQWLVTADRRIPLRQGENVIGRDPRSAIWLDAIGVSRRHARIVVTGRQAEIEDLGSKNGTLVRGVLLSGSAVLADGDSIGIGPVTVCYRRSESGISTVTMVVPM